VRHCINVDVLNTAERRQNIKTEIAVQKES